VIALTRSVFTLEQALGALLPYYQVRSNIAHRRKIFAWERETEHVVESLRGFWSLSEEPRLDVRLTYQGSWDRL
jgi:hypothetical protein